MANSDPSVSVYVELAPRALKLLVTSGGKVTAARSFALDAKADLAAFLAENGLSGAKRAALIGSKSFLHVSDEGELTTLRQPDQLLAHAVKLPHGFESAPTVVAVDALTGRAPQITEGNPWMLTMVDGAGFAAARQQLSELGLAPAELTLAAPIHVGAVAETLGEGESSLVVLLGEEESQLVWVSAAGITQRASAPLGYNSIYAAIQQALGLKFKAAAGKLFYNENYDFSGAVSKIVEPLAAILKPIVDSAPATFLHVVGLSDGQSWFVGALAGASGLRSWAPSVEKASAGLGGIDSNASMSGLRKLAASGASELPWVQAPLDVILAKAAAKPAVVASPAPVVKPVVKPVVTPTPVPKAVTTPPFAVAPKPVAAPAPAPAPKAATVPPVKPAGGTKAPFATKAPTPIPIKPAPSATRPPMPTRPPVKGATTPPISEAASSLNVEAPEVSAEPSNPLSVAPAKKPPVLVFALVGLIVVGIGVAVLMRSGNKAASPVASPSVPEVSAPPVAAKPAVVPAAQDQAASDGRKFKNDRYAFEVSEKGYIQSLSGMRNEVMVESAAGVSLQGSYVGADGRKKWFNVGGVDDAGYQAVVQKKLRDGITVFEVKVTHPRFEVEQTFSCLPESIKVSARFKPINLRDPRGVISAVHSVRLAPVALNPSSRMRAASDNFVYNMKAGSLTLTFDASTWARDGANELQTIVAGENSVAFHFTENTEPARNTLNYELALP